MHEFYNILLDFIADIHYNERTIKVLEIKMEDNLEKKLRELLPYIIIEAIIFLLMPLFMGHTAGAATYIIEVGVFPLTAVGCSVFYKLKQKKSELYVCAIAPLFYAIAALLYGMWRDSWLTVLIYMISYFICGYLGLLLSDVFLKSKADSGSSAKPAVKHPARNPERVNPEEHEAQLAGDFRAENPEEDQTLDTSTTENDVEALLKAIHSRKGQ